jgi:predicted Rossmann fold flavoprotein
MMQSVAIIGGGAAGMLVAATLAEADFSGNMLLFEKNSRLWAKVIISGGGRCNVTTGLYKKQELLSKYPRGAKFLEHAIATFWPRSIRRWFEAHGVPCKEEEDHRIFPVSDDGKDIVGVFERLFIERAVDVHCKESIQQISRTTCSDGTCRGFTLISDKGSYQVDHVVLTTWGNAYAHTGSSGDGYAFARALGHTITPLGPSLNSFLTTEERLHGCSGISFPHATLKTQDEKTTTTWPVLLTHFGLSGPATFAFSAHIPFVPITKEMPFPVLLQPDAKLTKDKRMQLFTKWATYTPKKEVGTLLRDYFTKRFTETLLTFANIDQHTFLSNLKKEDRSRLSHLLGAWIPLTFIQRRPGDEFVTAGGISLTEVDPKTGQSLLVPGLFFAGEILDIDGYTWGYNLTSSWAMGRVVGMQIAKE